MKIFKSTAWLMAILLILLIGYFFLLQIYKNKMTDKTETSSTEIQKPLQENKNITSNHNIADTNISIAFLTGKFNPEKEKSFTECDLEYASRKGIFLQEEPYKAFIKMFYAAKKEGINLKIISGTRNFYYQKSIWEQKWNGNKPVEGKNLALTVKNPVERAKIILKYSSMPGTSRHHWGTDIDLNSLENSYFETPEGKKVYDWLCKNAASYGFCQPYTAPDKNRNTGYEEEKWHWSYTPLSAKYLKEYKNKVTYDAFTGFSGCETARELKVIENYVMGVNTSCY